MSWSEELLTVPWLLAGLFAALSTFLLVRNVWRARSRRRIARRRTRRALRAERDAEKLLARAGYTLLERQPEMRWSVKQDGEPLSVDLRADLLVARRGRIFVADVKTGRKAPSLRTAATRRQLLEYRIAYDTDGVLLVDMEASEIHVVDFGLEPSRCELGVIHWILFAVAAASVGVLLWVAFG